MFLALHKVCQNILARFIFLPFKAFDTFRHYQYEQKLARLLWKVDWKDVRIMFENLEVGSQDVIEQVIF